MTGYVRMQAKLIPLIDNALSGQDDYGEKEL
jgi:hypothetical protein